MEQELWSELKNIFFLPFVRDLNLPNQLLFTTWDFGLTTGRKKPNLTPFGQRSIVQTILSCYVICQDGHKLKSLYLPTQLSQAVQASILYSTHIPLVSIPCSQHKYVSRWNEYTDISLLLPRMADSSPTPPHPDRLLLYNHHVYQIFTGYRTQI